MMIDLPDLDVNTASIDDDDFFDLKAQPKTDLFATHERGQIMKSPSEARCDFFKRVRLVKRGDVYFTTSWGRSIMGRTMMEIKNDDTMVPFFAEAATALLIEILGSSLSLGNWAICTTPRRRHIEKNFATRVSEIIANNLNVPFYIDAAFAKNHQRINAVFIPNNIPNEPNIIVYDDIVTTGSTLKAMRNLLVQFKKNLFFLAGINNA